MEFPAPYGIEKFITTFTSARHLSLSWVRSLQSRLLSPTSWKSSLLLSLHLRLSIQVVSFHQLSSSQPCMLLSCLHIRSTCPTHLILLDFVTRIIFSEDYRLQRSLLCSLLRCSVTLICLLWFVFLICSVPIPDNIFQQGTWRLGVT